MTVEQTKVVDFVSFDKESAHVILTISDHLDWSDRNYHLRMLQAKLNAYLAFVESGELVQKYPRAVGCVITFNLVFKFKPDQEGRAFLLKAQRAIEAAGFAFRSKLFVESPESGSSFPGVS